MMLPERLKAARTERGWTIEEVGAQLKLPARVVASVERGDFEGLGAPIYRRGYLRSFARLVGVAESEVEATLRSEATADPELIATGVMPRSAYVTERYLRPATYIALTALIALPVVWWAASGRLGDELAGSHSFSLQPEPQTPPVAVDGALTPALPQPLVVPPSTEIVRASMMTVPTEPLSGPPAPQATEVELVDPALVAAIGTGAHEAVLDLSADSWVEVAGADGRRIHQALLTPGRWHFHSDGRLSFKIGNSASARLTADGHDIDLAPHRSQNDVARVEVFNNEG